GVSLGLSAAACSKDDAAAKTDPAPAKDDKPKDLKPDELMKPAPDQPKPAPVATPTPSTPAPQALAIVGGSNPQSNADLAILPQDSEVVAGINLAQTQQSALWKQYMAPLITSKATSLKVLKTCGFDPLASITNASVGIKNLKSGHPDTVLVLH